ncbi:glycoside hydrolase family 3 protein [Candidatus Avelusimicrobium fimicolum]|uniref:glycoside hydrolase family 3 protein n=1 Tax=Candidatus Avelusimicrobium fimicolum TaxID=3416216 RepID=UPI003D0E4063
MKKHLFLCLVFSFTATAWGNPVPTVDDLSLREQVGQTIMPRVLIGEQKAFKQAVLNGEVTGFFIKAKEGAVTQPKITAKNQARFIARQRKRLEKTIKDLNKWAAKSPHKIPLLLAVDYEGGTVTSPMFMGLKQMPSNMLLAASGDEKVVADMYTAQAKEILLSGANTALGPVTDVNSNPLNPIIQTRSFGDNSADVGRFSRAASRALENNGVPSFIKHFPGHGDTSSDSHYEQPVTALPAEELWQTHISAFQPAITAGNTGVLSAHVVYPALDDENTASFSSKILKGLLREKMGFKGIIATDGLDMGAVKGVGVEEIVRRAYGAGNNLLLLSGDIRDVKTARTYPGRAADYVGYTQLAAEPAVSAGFVRESAEKILKLKERLGLFESRAFATETGFDEAAKQAAEAGVTLVRDTQNLLPLKDKKVCAVLFADGIFSLQLRKFTDTLSNHLPQVNAVYSPRTPGKADEQAARACMAGADVTVLGTSRTSVMDQKQYALVQDLLKQAEQNNQPAVLVSLLNPYEIALYPKAQTVLALYGPTADTARIAAEILLGLRPAKGHLPIKLK